MSEGPMTTSYSSEECDLSAEALALAWEHVRETGFTPDEALTKAALSHSILHAAGLGERNKQVLVAYALANMGPAKLAIQQRGWKRRGADADRRRLTLAVGAATA